MGDHFRVILAIVTVLIVAVHARPDTPPGPTTKPYSEPGFTAIFNGHDLAGWVYGTKDNGMKQGVGYQIDPGQGIVYSTVHDGGNLYTEKEYANFILRFEFKLTDNANNGIGIRAPLAGAASSQGMEIQILDDGGSEYTKLRPAQYCGSIYDVFPAERGFLKPVGEWNQEEIMADGRHVRVILNSHVIVDANLDDAKDPATLKKHPGLANKSGHIGFLGHGARVEFRNLRVKELPPSTEK
jgi:3-keto-disaccharide hydrolase